MSVNLVVFFIGLFICFMSGWIFKNKKISGIVVFLTGLGTIKLSGAL